MKIEPCSVINVPLGLCGGSDDENLKRVAKVKNKQICPVVHQCLAVPHRLSMEI